MISIDYQSRTPLYEQIVERFQRLILKGILEPGSQMPSVRTLAVKLSINPNTIQRAYGELERSGYIYMVKGRGSFVGSIKKLKEVRRLELSNKLSELAKEAECLDMDKDEFTSMASEAYSQMEKVKGEKNV